MPKINLLLADDHKLFRKAMGTPAENLSEDRRSNGKQKMVRNAST